MYYCREYFYSHFYYWDCLNFVDGTIDLISYTETNGYAVVLKNRYNHIATESL